MANKRIPPGLSSDDDETIIDSSDYEDISGIQNDIDSELDSIFAEFGGEDWVDDYRINVYRPLEGKGKLSNVFSCLPSELPISDKLRDEYDGGEFKIWIYRNKKRFKGYDVTIEPPSEMQKLAYREKVLKRKNELEKQSNTANTDAITNLANTMREGFANMQNSGGTDFKSMLETMALMKEVMGFNQAVNPFDMVNQVIDIQRKLAGDIEKDEESGTGFLTELLKTFGPPIVEMSRKEQELGQRRLAKHPMAAGKRLQNPKPQIADETKKEILEMKKKLAFLCRAAEKDADVETYANLVLDTASDNEIDGLIEFISHESAIENMAKIYPQVAKHREWFTRLGQAILAEVEEFDENGENDENEGNQGDTFNTVQNNSAQVLTSNENSASSINNATIIDDNSDAGKDTNGKSGDNRDVETHGGDN